MNKIKECFKAIKNDYRHLICIILIVCSLVLIPFCFKYAHLRIYESVYDLVDSCKYYISSVFGLELKGNLSVNDYTSVPYKLPFNLPSTWDDFSKSMSNYWSTFFNQETFLLYIEKFTNVFLYISKLLMICIPIICIFIIVKIFYKPKENNDYNQDSKPLKAWKKFERNIYLPAKAWLFEYVNFIREHKYYLSLFLFVWAYNFNLITIFIEFLAYYLFFIVSFKTITIYTQVIKLLMDLSVVINFIPNFIWITLICYVVHLIRKNIAYVRLDHMEYMDRGYINERPIVIMLNGTMGSKKTTMITDVALSQEIMFRDKAFELILKNDLMFPFFPFINLENELKSAINNHSVYNLATCRRFVNSKRLKWLKKPLNRNIFMYDYKRYGTTYYNELNEVDIWKMIENYAQLYFVYTVQSSLLISNYSIRTDNLFNDLGNFPIWNTELFRNDVKMQEAYSRHSHILDFDMLRLGKKLVDENAKANIFEFGVINITEIGKERQNTIELKDIKKTDSKANQKNDLFNSWLKMVRHSATIDNFPFVKVITDDQRPESWGADARDLCEIIFIDKVSNFNLAMPLFSLEELICDLLLSSFKKHYYNYRYIRGDNTLRMYLYHGFIGLVNKYYRNTYNKFGYYRLNTIIESGRQDGDKKESKYYLMSKKIYSNRFSTDAFSSFFNEKALRSKLGINDLDTFKNIKASFDEMNSMNSYFFNDLNDLRFDNDLSKKKK